MSRVIKGNFTRPFSLDVRLNVDILYEDAEVILVRLETEVAGKRTIQFIAEAKK
jgi:hypothetical protein